MDDRIESIRSKLARNSILLNPCFPLWRIEEFESKHEIVLPEAYRRFISEIGDGGPGPPYYGVCSLGGKIGENQEDDDYWTQIPHVRYDFPFTKIWIWEGNEDFIPSPEGEDYEVDFGSIRLGTKGCGLYFHLIVTGPERGIVWEISDVGICPSRPRGDFLDWYETWLDRMDRLRP